jgi:hypothetical protein
VRNNKKPKKSMSTFRERFKDKAVIVGKDGENAMNVIPTTTTSVPSTPTTMGRGSQINSNNNNTASINFKIGQMTAQNKLQHQQRKAQFIEPHHQQQQQTPKLPPILQAPKSAPQIRSFSTGAMARNSVVGAENINNARSTPQHISLSARTQHQHQSETNNNGVVVSLFGGFNSNNEETPIIQQKSSTTTTPVVTSLFGNTNNNNTSQPTATFSLFGGVPSNQQQKPIVTNQLPPIAPKPTTTLAIHQNQNHQSPPPPMFSTVAADGVVKRTINLNDDSDHEEEYQQQQQQTQYQKPKPLFGVVYQQQQQQQQKSTFELQNQDSPFNRVPIFGNNQNQQYSPSSVASSSVKPHQQSRSVAVRKLTGQNNNNAGPQRVNNPNQQQQSKNKYTLDTPKSNRSAIAPSSVGNNMPSSPSSQKSAIVTVTDYKPYSVEDYRKMKEKDLASKNKSKGLGPNDSDEVRKARELRLKMKDYGESNNKVNMTVLPQQHQTPAAKEPPPLPAPGQVQLSEDVVKARELRQKAKEFARNVPKPVVKDYNALLLNSSNKRADTPNTMTQQYLLTGNNNNSPSRENRISAAEQQRRDRLLELEAQHAQDRLMVEQLKKQLKI